MYKVQFKTLSGSPLTLYFTNTLSVVTAKNSNTDKLEVRIMDGNHNNGGWPVDHTYNEVINLIDNAIKFNKI